MSAQLSLTPLTNERLAELIAHGEVRCGNEITGLQDVVSALRELQQARRSLAELTRALQSYANGRCYPCGWPLKATAEEGCVIGNCSYRPSERTTISSGTTVWSFSAPLSQSSREGSMSEKSEECDGCGFVTAELRSYDRRDLPIGSAEKKWLCDLCACTAGGLTPDHSSIHLDNAQVLKTLCYIGNVILSRLPAPPPDQQQDGGS